jgi:hypothetical protein
MKSLQELKKELEEANNLWKQWELEEKSEPGKHALDFNGLGEEISVIKEEIKALEKNAVGKSKEE